MVLLSNQLNLRKKLVVFTLVSVIFTGVFCLITWPWAASFSEKIPGLADTFSPEESMNYADTYQYLGDYRLFQSGAFPWELFDLSSRSNLAILQLSFGEITGYNLWWFGSFFIAFWGCFALVWYLTKNYWGAFGAGLIFSLAPYHFAHSYGHSGAIWYGWLAFLALFLLRYFDNKSKADLLAGFFFFYLVIRADDHYALYGTVLIFVLLIYGFVAKKIKLRDFFCWPIMLGLGAAAVLGLLVLQSNFKVLFSADNWLVPPYTDVYNFSIDILAPFTPPSYHLTQGNQPLHSFNEEHYWFFSERTVYLGLATLALTIAAIWLANKKRQIKSLAVWLVLAAGFLIMALGTSLVLDGQVFEPLHLPYYWVYRYVPFFNIIRATGRIFVLSILGWSVLAGLGITFLLEKLPHRRKIITGIALAVIIALDFSYFNLPVGRPIVPKFYTEVLAIDKENSQVLEIPGSTDYAIGSMTNYYEMLSNHRKVNLRDYSRTGRVDVSNIKNNPILNTLAYRAVQPETPEIIKHDWPKLCPAVLKENNIGYIVLHLDYMPAQAISKERQLLQSCGVRQVFGDDQLQAYQAANNTAISSLYLTELNFHSSDPEALQTILIHNPTEETVGVDLNFTYQSKTYQPRMITLEYQETVIKTVDVPGFRDDNFSASVRALPGDSKLEIKYLGLGSSVREFPHLTITEITYSFITN